METDLRSNHRQPSTSLLWIRVDALVMWPLTLIHWPKKFFLLYRLQAFFQR